MKLFVDIDGVLADFVSALCEAHNRVDPYCSQQNDGIYDTGKIWKITPEELWAPTLGAEFWASMKPMPYLPELLNIIKQAMGGWEDVCLLSSPTWDPACALGKLQWIQQHMPKELYRQYLLGPAKRFCASDDAVLLDDYGYNCDKFEEAGGRAILWPQPWNMNHEIHNTKDLSWHLNWLFNAIQTIKKSLS